MERDQSRQHETGDNGKVARYRGGRLAEPRGGPRPPACIPNRLGENDTRTAAVEKHTTCRDGGRLLRVRASQKEFADLSLQVCKGSGRGRLPRIDDNGPPGREFGEVKTHGFSHPPFDPVPHDCFADRAGDGEPNPRALRQRLISGRAQTKCGEQRRRVAGALVIDLSKIAAAQDPAGFRKAEPVPCDRNG